MRRGSKAGRDFGWGDGGRAVWIRCVRVWRARGTGPGRGGPRYSPRRQTMERRDAPWRPLSGLRSRCLPGCGPDARIPWGSSSLARRATSGISATHGPHHGAQNMRTCLWHDRKLTSNIPLRWREAVGRSGGRVGANAGSPVRTFLGPAAPGSLLAQALRRPLFHANPRVMRWKTPSSSQYSHIPG